jgi:hypothetical protein
MRCRPFFCSLKISGHFVPPPKTRFAKGRFRHCENPSDRERSKKGRIALKFTVSAQIEQSQSPEFYEFVEELVSVKILEFS